MPVPHLLYPAPPQNCPWGHDPQSTRSPHPLAFIPHENPRSAHFFGMHPPNAKADFLCDVKTDGVRCRLLTLCLGAVMQTSASLLERLRTAPDDVSWRRLDDLYRPLIRRWLIGGQPKVA